MRYEVLLRQTPDGRTNEKQETRMLSQALNRAMLHSRNQLEGVNRKKLIFYLAVQLYCTLYCTSSKPASALLFN